MTVTLLAAATVNVACTDACAQSTGSTCECSCGGRNHSMGDGQPVPYTSTASTSVTMSQHPWQQQTWNNPNSGIGGSPLMRILRNRTVSSGDLSEQERNAIDEYAGPGYETLNDALRSGDWDTLRRVPTVDGKLADTVGSLDSAIAKGTVPADTVVFRGLQGDFADQLEVGDTIVDDGYLSTTVDPSSGAQFGSRSTMLMMELPAGTHAAAGKDDEYEVILPRGSRVEAVGFEAWQQPDGNVVQVVKARLLPGDAPTSAALTAATTINVACTDACAQSKGPHCECSCGGRNHSMADGNPVPYTSDASGQVTVKMRPIQREQWNMAADSEGFYEATAPGGPTTDLWAGSINVDYLTDEQEAAINMYVGADYRKINGALRSGNDEALDQVPEEEADTVPTYREAVRLLDEAVGAGTITSNVAVFRGLSGDFAEQLEVGDTVVDQGYLSVSVSPVTGSNFATQGRTMMMMELPKGTNAAPGLGFEREYILGRGSTVEIVGFEAWQHPRAPYALQVVKARLVEG